MENNFFIPQQIFNFIIRFLIWFWINFIELLFNFFLSIIIIIRDKGLFDCLRFLQKLKFFLLLRNNTTWKAFFIYVISLCLFKHCLKFIYLKDIILDHFMLRFIVQTRSEVTKKKKVYKKSAKAKKKKIKAFLIGCSCPAPFHKLFKIHFVSNSNRSFLSLC